MKGLLTTTLLVAAVAVLADAARHDDDGEVGAADTTSGTSPVTVCYVGTWAIYRPRHGAFQPEHIDARLCTHLVYAFVGITASGGVQILDEWLDLPSGLNGYGRFLALRKDNPEAKFLVGVGGWNQGSATFSAVAGDEKLRKTFARNAAEFVQKYGFDGLDVDWEYPGLRGGSSKDKVTFVALLQELHREMASRKLLLTAAVSVGLDKIDAGYDVPQLTKYLDLVCLMAYDLHGSWDGVTGMNAALRPAPTDGADNKNLNVEAALKLWLDRGADRAKLVLGLPFYGRTFRLANAQGEVDGEVVGVGAAAAGAGDAGTFTQEAGSLGYNEVCLLLDEDKLTEAWDEDRDVPYAARGNQWVSYDDAASLQLKTEFAIEQGLAGVMVWSLETDDFRGDCKTSGGAFPLLRAVQRVLRGAEPEPRTTSTTSSSTTTPSSSGSTSSSSSRSTSTTSTSRPMETTTAQSGEVCTTAGRYVRDAEDCSAFYYCQSVGQPLDQFPYHCPAGLVFDTTLQVCNWKDQVQC